MSGGSRRRLISAGPSGLGIWLHQLLLSFGLGSVGFAAVPALDHLYPVALQAGTTNTITAIGKIEPWPAQVWLDAPGVVFKPETNSGRFTVEVAADTPIGPHLVRVFNKEGASAPRFLIVTREPQVAEQEPNDDFTRPQVVERLPASLNGRLEKAGDVDSFAVPLEAGQTLIASVEAFTLASPVDAVVRLVNAEGVQVAWNHDGRTFDPMLAWTAPSAGMHVLQVFGFAYPAGSEVRFTGSARCVYRLHLSRGPWLRHTLPLGVQRGTRSTLQVAGWNLRPGRPREAEFDGTVLPPEAATAPLQVAGFDNGLRLPVGEGREWMEHEPNDVPSTPQCLEVPGAVTGCIDKAGDEDRFAFAAKKSEKFLLEVQSASLGFPVDAWLRMEDRKGKELARNDDSGSADPKLEWTAPENGTFVAATGNVLHRGGAECLYRFSVRRATPAVKVTVSETAFSVAPGRTNELKVTVKRLHGFKEKLTVSARGLPDGLEAESGIVPEKGGETTLRLVASVEAKPFSGPIQIVATEAASGKEHRAVADLTSATVDNGVPGGFPALAIEATDQLWLTVLPIPATKATAGK